MNELISIREALAAKLVELNSLVCALDFNTIDAQVICAQMSGVQSAINRTDEQIESLLRETEGA